jgi:hypothetical protein
MCNSKKQAAITASNLFSVSSLLSLDDDSCAGTLRSDDLSLSDIVTIPKYLIVDQVRATVRRSSDGIVEGCVVPADAANDATLRTGT